MDQLRDWVPLALRQSSEHSATDDFQDSANEMVRRWIFTLKWATLLAGQFEG
jgi:hypothetical protein